MKIYDSILQTIDNTPMVKLHKVTGGVNADILAKYGFINPNGNLKDRITLRMIEEAEKAGKLREGA